ncbi:MAG: hypothetical protein ACKUBY_06130 [Candidatus Moraniibacteriota bacterium]|jgi:hypothetical protein
MLNVWLFAIFLASVGVCVLEFYDYYFYKNNNTYKNLFERKNITEFVELRKKQSLMKAKISIIAIVLVIALGVSKYYCPQYF